MTPDTKNEDEPNQKPTEQRDTSSESTTTRNGKMDRIAAAIEEDQGRTDGADRESEQAFQDGKIRQWAIENGIFLETRPDSLKKQKDTGRNEHYAWLDPIGFGDKIVKIPKNKSTTPLNDTPLKYIKRWVWMEELFGIKSHLHGVTKDGELILVQDFIEGEHPDSQEALDFKLLESGWQKLGATKWLTPDKMWIIEDVDPSNFIEQSDGSIIPIDVDILPSTRQAEQANPDQGDMFGNFN